MMPTLSSVVAPVAVFITISGETSDDYIDIMMSLGSYHDAKGCYIKSVYPSTSQSLC